MNRSHIDLSGFVYLASPLAVMTFPDGLCGCLSAFARQFSRDALHPTALLLGAMLWVQVTEDGNLMPENFTSNAIDGRRDARLWPVPSVHLAEFLVYFPHWLQTHQYPRLMEFVHPLRFVRHAVDTDVRTDRRMAVQRD